jgi:hypothetical protein
MTVFWDVALCTVNLTGIPEVLTASIIRARLNSTSFQKTAIFISDRSLKIITHSHLLVRLQLYLNKVDSNLDPTAKYFVTSSITSYNTTNIAPPRKSAMAT